MNKIQKITLVVLLSALLSACANSVTGPEIFKNYSAKQILAGGEKELAKGDYKDSIKYFEAIDALYPFSPEAKQGDLDVIYAYYKAEDYALALAAADRYTHLYPMDKHTDYAYYIKGMVNFDKDRTWLQKIHTSSAAELDLVSLKEAFANFSTLIELFPNSQYANDARKHMLYIRSLLAKHELVIAKFYLARHAYIAAANRASDIVKNFKGAPQTKEALQVMVESYTALGLTKQADDAAKILKLN